MQNNRRISYEKVLDFIKSGAIKQILIEPTDTEGKNCEAVYQYEGEQYPVYLSFHCEGTFEEQAADQIFDTMRREAAAK